MSLILLTSSFANVVYAADLQAPLNAKNTQTISNDAIQEDTVSSKLQKNIKDAIVEIYGKDDSEEIFNRVMQIADKAVANRSETLKQSDLNRTDDWYKDEIIYMFYIDQFGVKNPDQTNTFKDTEKMFGYLKDLGVTTLQMLPFADSPMQDAGFDVKDPRNVRKDLGGMSEFKDFIKEAKKQGFKIKADLVLNHFSQEHEWFKAIEKGDISKLDYFIVREEMPQYKKYQDEKLGTVVEYYEKDGKISKRRLIFPENTENHWRKVTVNNKDYYFYHTFYPFQLDINWENPEVLYYCLETISYWSNLGIDIFRMDAIPYLSKEPGTNAENQPKTHAIIRLLSNYIQVTAPSSVIQVEACQIPKDILPYFGKERTVDININNVKKELKRTDEAQIAYHFPYMPALWAAFITEDNKYFTEANKATPSIPNSTSWATFLRVHDELTLEMVSPEVRQVIYDALEPLGAEFRKGFGVSGRAANFLNNNADRIIMAYSTLLSLPGIPIIYYGDEIAAQNNFSYAKKAAKKREQNQKKNKIKLLSFFDSRDINRGVLTYDAFYSTMRKPKGSREVKHMIELRKQTPALSRGSFTLLKTNSPKDLAYIREYEGQKYLIIHNLGSNKRVAEINLPVGVVFKPVKKDYVYLENILNGEKYKVRISPTQKTTRLLMYPYATVWLKII